MYVLYIIRTFDRCRSYVGITVNLRRRLRQHNGEITGGAKATRGRGPWVVVGTVHGLPSKRVALQLEWALHNVRKLKRVPKPPRRISPTRRRVHNLLWGTLPRRKWTSRSPYCCKGLTVCWPSGCGDRAIFCDGQIVTLT